MSGCVRIQAKFVVAHPGHILHPGQVVVNGARVLEVSGLGGEPDIDLGETVLLPGLVNAHTHLDLSDFSQPIPAIPKHRRLIPTKVKIEVWKRDGGKCVKCEATEDLHFDHIIPFSKGGSSNTPDNIQLLCGRHNLEKHDKIK